MAVEITGTDPAEIDKALGKLDVSLRGKVLNKALKAAGRPVIAEYRSRITKRGYPGDKPEKKSLRSAIGFKGKKYRDTKFVGVVGARVQSPWSAHHAHLYEHGHRMVVARGPRKGRQAATRARVEGKKALIPATKSTQAKQRAAMLEHIRDAVQSVQMKGGRL